MHKAECITPCRLRDVQSIARNSYPSYLSHPILHRSILKPGLLTNWLTVRIFFLGHLQDQKINEFYCGVLHWLSFINLKFSTATVLPSSPWVCKLVMACTCKILSHVLVLSCIQSCTENQIQEIMSDVKFKLDKSQTKLICFKICIISHNSNKFNKTNMMYGHSIFCL